MQLDGHDASLGFSDAGWPLMTLLPIALSCFQDESERLLIRKSKELTGCTYNFKGRLI